LPTVPGASGDVVVILNGADAATVIERAFVAVAAGDAESVAFTVKLVAPPAVVGVPDMSPVVAFRLSPAGRAPTESDQV
jgi:hypothetical protein